MPKLIQVLLTILIFSIPDFGNANTYWLYRLIGNDCGKEHSERYFTGFRIEGKGGIYTALHASVGCATLTGIRADGGEVASSLQINQVDLRRDVAVLADFETDNPIPRGGFKLAASVAAKQTLRVWGFPYGMNSILDTPLYVPETVFGNWRGSNWSIISRISARRISATETSPALDAQMININGDMAPGESGAPIVNDNGEVVAIGHGGLMGGSAGIGFATPIWEIRLEAASTEKTANQIAMLKEQSPDGLFSVPGTNAREVAEATLTRLGLPPTQDNFLAVAEAGDTANIALFLAAGLDPDTNIAGGTTALYRAAIRGHSEAVRILLSAGADRFFTDENGYTVLEAAIIQNENSVSKLQTASALAGYTQPAFVAALHDPKWIFPAVAWATRRDDVDLVRLFLDENPTIVEVVDEQGNTLLHYAASNSADFSIRLLMERGAKLTENDAGESPLDLALNTTWPEHLVRAIAESRDNALYCSIVHKIVSDKSVDLSYFFLNKDVNVKLCDGRSALWIAMYYDLRATDNWCSRGLNLIFKDYYEIGNSPPGVPELGFAIPVYSREVDSGGALFGLNKECDSVLLRLDEFNNSVLRLAVRKLDPSVSNFDFEEVETSYGFTISSFDDDEQFVEELNGTPQDTIYTNVKEWSSIVRLANGISKVDVNTRSLIEKVCQLKDRCSGLELAGN